MLIRADLHIHAGDDPFDFLPYSPRDVVDHALSLGLSCVAVTNHRQFLFSQVDAEYARSRGVLLIPGIEASIQLRDVIILNASADAENLCTFEQVRAYRTADRAVIAPHPFYPIKYALHQHAATIADFIDAVELSACYLSWHDRYNQRARDFAAQRKLPLVANSDAHGLWMMGTSWTEIDADEFSVPAVIAAIRRGSIRPMLRPMSLFNVLRFTVFEHLARGIRRRWRRCRGTQSAPA